MRHLYRSHNYGPAAGRYREEIRECGRAARGGVAQVERVLVAVAVQAADQQELFRVAGFQQRPAAVAGPFVPFPADRRSNTARAAASSARTGSAPRASVTL